MSDNSDRISNIVVMMMENRSFDHMLGYLRLRRGRRDVQGLTGRETNQLRIPGHARNGEQFAVRRLDRTASPYDPCHSSGCAASQTSQSNSGFVDSFARHYHEADPGYVMGYHDETQLPVYDFLAREHAICDQWFSSVLGPTQINRLYALAGHSMGLHDPPQDPEQTYDVKTIFDFLNERNVGWRYFYHNVPFLAAIRQYLFDTNHVVSVERGGFYDQARLGTLPPVTYIEPNLYGAAGGPHNDDHPPVDVTFGQMLVRDVYNALVAGPKWNQTLLLITYDEHGGWYDHVPPPRASDERSDFRRYGVRVPAFIISPWVPAGMAFHEVYDHTSILKTILWKHCRTSIYKTVSMTARVNDARHVWPLLSLRSPRPPRLIPPISPPPPQPIKLIRPSVSDSRAGVDFATHMRALQRRRASIER